jgi:hypothetical protein
MEKSLTRTLTGAQGPDDWLEGFITSSASAEQLLRVTTVPNKRAMPQRAAELK